MKTADAVLVAVGSLIACAACNVSVGEGDGFTDTDTDTDTDFFGDPTDESDGTPDSSTDDEVDMGGGGAENDGTDSDDTMSTDDSTMTDADSGACTAYPENICEQCMAADCTTPYTKCACDAECNDAFIEMQNCYLEKNFEESQPVSEEEFAECQELGGAGDGSRLGNLAACIEATYTGQPDSSFQRYPGDGVCTYVCYGLYSVVIDE